MKLSDLTDRQLVLPYAAAGWAAGTVLAITVAVQQWGPVPGDPQTILLVRLGGGWIALLTGALVWFVISEPMRLRRKVDEATEKLQASEEKYRELYDQAPLAYLTLAEDGTIKDVNDRFEEVLGYPREEVIGARVLDLFEEGEEGRDRAKDLLERFHAGDRIRGQELAMRTQDGQTLWVTFTVRSVHHDDEAGSRTLSMVMDITERKRAEERLEYYARELERSNEDLQQFAYVVSHDLQEPIRMVKSYLGLLERRYGGELDQEALEFIDYAVDGADRMEALIKSLLDYARVGTQAEPFEQVDLGEVLQDVEADLAMSIEETDASIEHGELPTLTADPNQLRQLIQNLVGNAIKYNESGQPRVRISAEREGDAWELAIDDNGPGIPEGERGKIFDVFHRVGARPDESGTGMGLAICRRIAERHGGEIRVGESELGGARFVVQLQVQPGDATGPHKDVKPVASSRKAGR